MLAAARKIAKKFQTRMINFKKPALFGIALFCCSFFPTAYVCSQDNCTEVCFRHKIRDTLKRDCIKLKGAHDAFPVFRCDDKKTGEYVPFDPGKDWQVFCADQGPCPKQKSVLSRVPKGIEE